MDSAVLLAWAGTLVLGVTLYLGGSLVRPVMHWRRNREPRGPDRGPAPGYTLYPSDAVDTDRVVLGEGWRPWSLETFHLPDRQRLVLTVCPTDEGGASLDTSAQVEAMLSRCSQAMMEMADVDVVVVEAMPMEPGPSLARGWVVVRSRDGRGWSGRESGAAFVLKGPGGSAPE